MSEFSFCPKCGAKLIKKIPPTEEAERLVCTDCGFVLYNNPKPTVGAVIERGGKVLLVKRSRDPYRGAWDMPGGFVDEGETLDEALVREVYEETGLKPIKWHYYFNGTDVYTNATDNHVSNNLGVHFIVEVEEGEPQAADDVEDYGWFPWDNLPENLAGFQDVMKVIEKRKKEMAGKQNRE